MYAYTLVYPYRLTLLYMYDHRHADCIRMQVYTCLHSWISVWTWSSSACSLRAVCFDGSACTRAYTSTHMHIFVYMGGHGGRQLHCWWCCWWRRIRLGWWQWNGVKSQMGFKSLLCINDVFSATHSIWLCIYPYIRIFSYVCVRMRVRVCVGAFVYAYLYICMCVFLYAYVYIHTHTRTYTYVYAYI